MLGNYFFIFLNRIIERLTNKTNKTKIYSNPDENPETVIEGVVERVASNDSEAVIELFGIEELGSADDGGGKLEDGTINISTSTVSLLVFPEKSDTVNVKLYDPGVKSVISIKIVSLPDQYPLLINAPLL